MPHERREWSRCVSGGSILLRQVNNLSVHPVEVLGCYAYAIAICSRFAWEGFTESLSKELPPEWNINLMTVHPAAVKTDYLKKSIVVAERLPCYVNANSGTNSMLSTIEKHHELDTFGGPEQLVEVVGEVIKEGGGGHGIPRQLAGGPDSWTVTDKALDKEKKVHQEFKSAAFRMAPQDQRAPHLEAFI